MTFHVTPDDLASFSKQLGRAAEDVSAAKSYMERECSVGTFGAGPVSAIASVFGGGHDGVMENVRAALVKMNAILKASQAEMSRCAEYYSATDHGEASRLDAQYPESKR
ncbi:WXG100 family type VII secretion target [Streptomyces sp. NPDC052302]|uniref:WXG100 family type VII secretion target n=1 Tax=unclassified Streptomyces TaxID=2593676 RepID=UPI0037D69EDA